MHQYAQWRGGEEDRGGSLTTRGFLFSWLPFGTCASKSRWHVGALGGSVSLNKLPVHIHSTYPVMSLGEGDSTTSVLTGSHWLTHLGSITLNLCWKILSSSGSWRTFFPIATLKAQVLAVFAVSELVACLFFSSSVIHSKTHLFLWVFLSNISKADDSRGQSGPVQPLPSAKVADLHYLNGRNN